MTLHRKVMCIAPHKLNKWAQTNVSNLYSSISSNLLSTSGMILYLVYLQGRI